MKTSTVLIIGPLAALFMIACSSNPVQRPSQSPLDALRVFTVSVTMSSQGLWSRAYEIHVDQSGKGEFKGKFGAQDFSSVPLSIQQSRVDELRRAIAASQFFTTPHVYAVNPGVVDAGTIQITIVTPLETQSATFVDAADHPISSEERSLRDLAEAVHRAVDSAPLLERYCAWLQS